MWLEGVTLDIHTTVQAKNAAKLEVLPETLGTRSASLRTTKLVYRGSAQPARMLEAV